MMIGCGRKPELVLLLAIGLLCGETNGPGTALPRFVRGNEILGRKLLLGEHSNRPGRNVVISPVSVSLALASLQAGAPWGEVRSEIGAAFGWGANPELAIPARMLLAAFDDYPPSHEGTRIENLLLYREPLYFSPRYVAIARKYFGVRFVSTGASMPGNAAVQRARKSTAALPAMSARNAAVISSGIHLSTAWQGNTFALEQPFQSNFAKRGEAMEPVETLRSELTFYQHAKTETFEAVALPCYSAYMIVVMPAAGRSLMDLERDLVASPDALDAALTRQLGRVTMPTWRIRIESRFRPLLEDIGVRTVFSDLGEISTIPRSFLTEVNQKVDFQVDQVGIRADAETAVGSHPGGVMSTPNLFRMIVNRPFLFLVRDQMTNALLFAGAVMDPAEK